MGLSLNLPIVNKQETIVTLSDMLSAEIEYAEACQAFVDYKNVCEIVFKAKASEERLAFAKDLIGSSVENIQVSAEGLNDTFKNMWQKFAAWWNKFTGWIRGIHRKILENGAKKYNHIMVKPEFSGQALKEISEYFNDILISLKTNKPEILENGVKKLHARFTARKSKKSDEGKVLQNQESLTSWLSIADHTIEIINNVVKMISGEIPKATNENKNIVLGARYVTRYASQMIKSIQAAIISALKDANVSGFSKIAKKKYEQGKKGFDDFNKGFGTI